MLTTLLAVAIGASLIAKEVVTQEHIGYCSMIALLLGAMAGTVTAVKKIKHRKLMVSMLSALVYVVILLSVTALLFGGQYSGVGVTVIMVLCGSLIGLILSNGKEGRGLPRRRRKFNR